MQRFVLVLLAFVPLLFACVPIDTVTYNASCVTNVSSFEVRGSSLAGVIEPGTTITVLEGYHQCNNLNREDIVTYHFAGNEAPIIKIVKAIPGDTWYLDGCNIIVNNKTLVTKNKDGTDGAPYCISDTRRLQLYVDDYPLLPNNTYLLMGNQPDGSVDSSVFGLVDAQDIIGKIER